MNNQCIYYKGNERCPFNGGKCNGEWSGCEPSFAQLAELNEDEY